MAGSAHDVTIAVENSGPMIAADVVPMLFEPLQRGAHAESEAERTSLGLGLFIVRQVARAHGGTVALSSAEGKTVFVVTLPRNPPTF